MASLQGLLLPLCSIFCKGIYDNHIVVNETIQQCHQHCPVNGNYSTLCFQDSNIYFFVELQVDLFCHMNNPCEMMQDSKRDEKTF